VDDELGLSWYGPEDAPDVLDDASSELDREGQEDAVQGRAIEAFAYQP
jgi:hypothetical protein